MQHIDSSSYEPGAICLKLRGDLSFRRQSFGDETCYVIEDASASRFYRIGLTEYRFISLLDGRTTIAAAVAHCATQHGDGAITESQAAAFCSWLVQNSLASTPQSRRATRLIEKGEQAAAGRMRQWLNPVTLKIPLGSPNNLVRWITPAVGWVYGGAGFFIWMLTVAAGGYSLFSHWDRISGGSMVLSADNWLWLALTALFLKLIHETAHAVACRRFGGDTREAGILLLLFVPLPYVDVTTAWRFGSKWQRMIVSAAGMYAEIFIAAIAAIVFTQTNSEVAQHHAINIMLTAGFVTVMFNLNPLMRFDGYYILTDLLELPNLGAHGQQDLNYLARRWLLGVKSNRPQWPEGRSAFIRLYGAAALVWRIMICVSLALAAEMLYHGAGIVLAVAAVCLWVVVPVFKFIRYFIVGDPVNPPHRLRFIFIAGTLLLAGSAIWNYAPYIERLQLAAVVECEDIVEVRTATAGFVRKLAVRSGDNVVKGQLLARLENPQLEARIAGLKLAIQQSHLDSTRYHRQGDMPAFQVEVENKLALKKRMAQLQLQASKLTLTAPSKGVILSRNLDDLQNRWLGSGSSFCLLGNDSSQVIYVVIPQSDIAVVRSHQQPVNVHIWGQPREFNATIQDIESRGTTAVRHPSLTANAGGPLAVHATQTAGETTWELLEPHFHARVQAPNLNIQPAGSGQTAMVELTTSRGAIGQVIVARIKEFLLDRQSTKR